MHDCLRADSANRAPRFLYRLLCDDGCLWSIIFATAPLLTIESVLTVSLYQAMCQLDKLTRLTLKNNFGHSRQTPVAEHNLLVCSDLAAQTHFRMLLRTSLTVATCALTQTRRRKLGACRASCRGDGFGARQQAHASRRSSFAARARTGLKRLFRE